MKLSMTLITIDKSHFQELYISTSKIEETYTSRTSIDLFITSWIPSFLNFNPQTYNLPIISLEIPTTNKCGHIKVNFLLRWHDVKKMCIVFVVNLP